ncbi:MAG: hypothetical protein Ct9H300mP8_09640 [Gammaproteobacteria bacterium]|nr:MAG: hypothetical protein Ct9H300mP8_09640 [Gammaproteobacteria bacterium]
MLEQVPGCYLLIGNGDGDERHPLHHPSYDLTMTLRLRSDFFCGIDGTASSIVNARAASESKDLLLSLQVIRPRNPDVT